MGSNPILCANKAPVLRVLFHFITVLCGIFYIRLCETVYSYACIFRALLLHRYALQGFGRHYKLLFTYRVTMMQKAAKLSLEIYSIPRLRDNYVIYLQL